MENKRISQGTYRISNVNLPKRPEMSEYFFAGLKDGGALIDESKRIENTINIENKTERFKNINYMLQYFLDFVLL